MIHLRPYQQAAADKLVGILKARRIAYLCGAVRTGKTLTAMDAIRQLGVQRVLVLTKKKAIASIEKDRDGYGLTDRVTVTNYEQAGKYTGQSWGLLVVDEAHGVGAYPKPSKRFKDIRAMNYSMVLLMSGTPSPESYSQLYHQFALGSAPWGAFRNFYRWADRYVNVCKKYVGTGTQVNDYSQAKEADILRDIAPLTVTVTQEQAGFTTQIDEHVHRVTMLPRTYRMAKRIMKDGVIGKYRKDGKAGRVVLADSGAKAMSKLRQMYSGTVITEAHGAVIFDRSKVEYIQRTFTGKTAILYTFNAEGDMLKAAYEGRWTDSPEAFNADPGAVFIGQVRASREGVNLSSADDLIFFGVDYAALSYLQGRDRASYLGRDRANRVHWIIAADGIEEKVMKIVKEKEDYTVNHFRHDRASYTGQNHQAARGRGVVRGEADPDEQNRDNGSHSHQAERGAMDRGQATRAEAQQGAAVPARGVAQLGIFG
jgi:hypothetical protein